MKSFGYIFNRKRFSYIFIASITGGAATALLFTALSIANASKVYPLSGIQIVFITLLGVLLKEGNIKQKIIGTIMIFIGIYSVMI